MMLVIKSVRGPMGRMFPAEEQLTKYHMGRFHFVWHIAMRLTGGWTTAEKGKRALSKGGLILREFLKDNGIKFGDSAYSWTPLDAHLVAEEYGMRS